MDEPPPAPASRRRRPLRALVVTVLLLAVCGLLAVGAGYGIVHLAAHAKVSDDPHHAGATGRRIALVLGAGLDPDGSPSRLLAQRLDAAVALYRAHRARVLLMSGDNGKASHDEPLAMARYAHEHGVPWTALALDDAGRRTYDSCWRVRHVFSQRHVTIVTSHYHAPRAVYVCRSVGVNADALAAPERNFAWGNRLKWYTREVLADGRSVLDAAGLAPHPVAGDTIDPFDACAVWQSLSVEDRWSRPHGC